MELTELERQLRIMNGVGITDVVYRDEVTIGLDDTMRLFVFSHDLEKFRGDYRINNLPLTLGRLRLFDLEVAQYDTDVQDGVVRSTKIWTTSPKMNTIIRMADPDTLRVPKGFSDNTTLVSVDLDASVGKTVLGAIGNYTTDLIDLVIKDGFVNMLITDDLGDEFELSLGETDQEFEEVLRYETQSFKSLVRESISNNEDRHVRFGITGSGIIYCSIDGIMFVMLQTR